MADVNEMFKDVSWEEIEAQEDYENDITPLQGDYKAVIKSFDYQESFNFYSMNAQVVETVKGVKGDNRYVSRTFNLGESEYANEDEAKEKLLKALKTIGAKTPAEAVGKTVCLKVRPNKDKDGNVKRDKKDWPKHIVTIVKEFKGATDSANVSDAGSGKIPF